MATADRNTRFRITEEKRRILLVEDDIVNQEMLRESLGETYDMVIVETGEEALDILSTQHETLSIVLLDLNLPDMNGIDILKNMQGDAETLIMLLHCAAAWPAKQCALNYPPTSCMQ